MSNENGQALELAKEAVKEVAKDAYADVGRPIAKPTGELVGLVPRAIKAALAPVEKWVLQREYNVAETKLLLEKKLERVQPELIEAPEPFIAVPALQYISYCMDNDELRDMYANLLANSMNSVVKNGVHPGFVEIIKQLCPDEARILKHMQINLYVPTISLRVSMKTGGTKVIVKEFSNIPRICGCENPVQSEKYFDNLVRLGLVDRFSTALTDKENYNDVKADEYVLKWKNDMELAIKEIPDAKDVYFGEHYLQLTAFGRAFCNVCIDQ